jgi:hydrogenase large subunit
MTAAAVQTLDISPVGRVEGDLDVRVNIENGVVVDAWTAQAIRGYELILRDRTRRPAWCHAARLRHLRRLASPAAWASTPPGRPRCAQRVLARNLGQIAEHPGLPRHTGLFMIDFVNKNYRSSSTTGRCAAEPSPAPATSWACHLGPAGRIYAARRAWPHSATWCPAASCARPPSPT